MSKKGVYTVTDECVQERATTINLKWHCSGVCHPATRHPAPDIPCPCGEQARVLRMWPATVATILGPITCYRTSYQCPSCRQTRISLDTQLHLCAGGISAGLQELLALLGATQDSFARPRRRSKLPYACISR